MSEVKVDKISPKTGTSMTVGDSGDTFTVPSGATLTVAGALNVTGTTSLADGYYKDGQGFCVTVTGGAVTQLSICKK